MMSKRARLVTTLFALVMALAWVVAPAQAKPQDKLLGPVLEAPPPPPDDGDRGKILTLSEGDPDELTGGNLSIIETQPREEDRLNLWQQILLWLTSLRSDPTLR
jgi:hypothetical protein